MSHSDTMHDDSVHLSVHLNAVLFIIYASFSWLSITGKQCSSDIRSLCPCVCVLSSVCEKAAQELPQSLDAECIVMHTINML